MTSRPSLTRSVPFWILVAGSLVSALTGAWIIADRLGVMTTTLTDGSATGVEVYVGQSLVIVGAALLAAGILGILITLSLAVVRSMLPAPAPVVVEPIDWTEEDIVEPAADATDVLEPTDETHAPGAPVTSEDDAAVEESVPAQR